MSESEKLLQELLEYTTNLVQGNSTLNSLDSSENPSVQAILDNIRQLKSSSSVDRSEIVSSNKTDSADIELDSMIKELNFLSDQKSNSTFSKVFFNSIINSLNDAIWSSSVDQSIIFFLNPAYENLTGYNREEIISNPSLVRKMIHPEDYYIYQSASVDFIKAGFCNCQYRIITKGNEIKWVLVKVLLIRDDEGNAIRIDGVLSDITESKKAIELELNRASDLLLQQEVLFRLSCLGSDYSFEDKIRRILKDAAKVLNIERVGIWIFDKDNSLMKCESMFELSSGEYLPSVTISENEYPVYFEALKQITHRKAIVVNDVYEEHFTNEILEDFLTPLGITSILIIPITKDNELFGIISLSHVGKQREWKQDEQVFVTSVSNIISIYFEAEERRIVESALMEKTRVLLEAQHVARIGNYVIDLVTGTWKSSAVFDQIFGIDRNYVKDVKNWIKLISPEHSLNVFNVFKEVVMEKSLNSKKRFDVSFKIIRQNDGEERWVTVLGEFQYDESGNPTHMLGTMQDITERKTIEEALIKSKEIAEELLSIKGNFLSNMSHEIRTPLNAIVGFTRFLKETNLDKEQMEMMNAIDFSGNNLLVIVNDILDFSKMEANKMTFEETNFSLSDSLKNTLNLMVIKAEEKRLNLEYKIDSQIEDQLIGDPTRLNQILINLVGNAIKFTENGSVEVSAKLLKDYSHSIDIEFSIKDTGIGIAEENIDSIFESFNQATNSTTRKYGGSGLGLTITKKLIELQGGEIYVSSALDEGSVFAFNLSFKKQSNPTEVGEEFEEELGINHFFLENKQILMVEDILINQLLARKIFNKWHCNLDIASNGLEAVEMVKHKKFDLILMDIQMPEMDGHAATRHIRKSNGINSKVPIIALSAHANTFEEKRCIDSGMNAFVSKPIYEEILLKEMLKWLNLSSDKRQYTYLRKVITSQETGSLLKLNRRLSGEKVKSVIDFDYLNNVLEGDPVFIKELIGLVLLEVPKLLESIHILYEKNDPFAFKAEIHKLKASIALFGVIEAKELIYNMENKIFETESLEGMKSKLDHLNQICLILLDELKKMV